MKFTRQTECAIEMLVQLHRRHGKVVRLAKLVSGVDMTFGFERPVVQRLIAAGLVKSVQGRNGGYQLGRARITLWDIVEAMEGPVRSPRKVGPSVERGYAVLADRVSKGLGRVSLLALTRE